MEYIREYLQKHNFRPEIQEQPDPSLQICIVVPSYKEEHLTVSLEALWKCDRPTCTTEVIVVVNAPENSSHDVVAQNLKTLEEISSWRKKHKDPKLIFHMLYKPNLPKKHAGVGMARKIGMDEAVNRLHLASCPKGIIAGFDADSVCDSNYLTELENHFKNHPKSPGASIYFEHPLQGDFAPETFQGIFLYELHLRYLNQALRYTGHPHAYHTVGSSFAVRMDAYVKQGGMNKRQAGEDFYFLQKIISLGNFTEINTTRVIPSPRESDRVPFGTGASMKKWHSDLQVKTYTFELFENLKFFLDQTGLLYLASNETLKSIVDSLHPSLQEYLTNNQFETELSNILKHCASEKTFRNRFFHWFNVFMVIKYLNYASIQEEIKANIILEAKKLSIKYGHIPNAGSHLDLLGLYRKLDREGLSFSQQ